MSTPSSIGACGRIFTISDAGRTFQMRVKLVCMPYQCLQTAGGDGGRSVSIWLCCNTFWTWNSCILLLLCCWLSVFLYVSESVCNRSSRLGHGMYPDLKRLARTKRKHLALNWEYFLYTPVDELRPGAQRLCKFVQTTNTTRMWNSCSWPSSIMLSFICIGQLDADLRGKLCITKLHRSNAMEKRTWGSDSVQHPYQNIDWQEQNAGGVSGAHIYHLVAFLEPFNYLCRVEFQLFYSFNVS